MKKVGPKAKRPITLMLRSVFQEKTSFTDCSEDSIPPVLTPTKLYGPKPVKKKYVYIIKIIMYGISKA